MQTLIFLPVVIEFCMSIYIPSQHRNLRLFQYQKNPPRMQLTWQTPSLMYGEFKPYLVHWNVQGGDVKLDTVYSRSYTSGNLQYGTTYVFKVSAINNYGMGPPASVTYTTNTKVRQSSSNISSRSSSRGKSTLDELREMMAIIIRGQSQLNALKLGTLTIANTG